MQHHHVAQAAPRSANRRKVLLIVAAVAAALLLYFSSLTILSSMQLLDFGPSSGTISYAPNRLSQTGTISLDAGAEVQEAAWSPNGAFVATAGNGPTIALHHLPDGKLIGTLDASSSPLALFFSPDSRSLVAAMSDNTIHVWNAADQQLLYPPIKATMPLKTVMISADGQRIHAAGADGSLEIWQVANGQRLLQRTGKLPPIADAVAWSEDGSVLAYADAQRGVVLWSLEKDEEQRVFDDSRSNERVVALAFSHLGGLVAAQDASGQVQVFRTQTGQKVQTFRWAGQATGDAPAVSASSFSADARLFALGGNNGRIELWDVQQGQLRATLDGGDGPVRGFGFTDDGTTMGVVYATGSAQLWHPGGAAAR